MTTNDATDAKSVTSTPVSPPAASSPGAAAASAALGLDKVLVGTAASKKPMSRTVGVQSAF